MLIFGTVNLHSIQIALCNRIFEGLASDNLLHFALNTAYAQSPREETASSFIGYSLALYMVGISASPFVAGLFKDFAVSFMVAIGLFVTVAAYLQLCVTPKAAEQKSITEPLGGDEQEEAVETDTGRDWLPERPLQTLISPLRTLGRRHSALFSGLSLLAYNLVQSYMFNALLIHTSLKFGFTGRENGFLVAMVHSIGAAYIYMTLYIMPWLMRMFSWRSQESALDSGRTIHTVLAPLSLVFQSSSLLAVGFASKAWQVYFAATLLAVGLPTPSFIKAHVIGKFGGSEKSEALAALAMMETVGDVLGPLALGGWQSYSALAEGVFFLASGIVDISLAVFVCGLISSR